MHLSSTTSRKQNITQQAVDRLPPPGAYPRDLICSHRWSDGDEGSIWLAPHERPAPPWWKTALTSTGLLQRTVGVPTRSNIHVSQCLALTSRLSRYKIYERSHSTQVLSPLRFRDSKQTCRCPLPFPFFAVRYALDDTHRKLTLERVRSFQATILSCGKSDPEAEC